MSSGKNIKTLLINPEFPDSFWSLQQTNRIVGRKTLLPPLGLITVAALLPTEWDLRLVDLNIRRLTPEDWEWTDLVMISGMFVQGSGLLDLVRKAKKHGKTVVVGGPYATSMPDEPLAAGCDFLVCGEVENSIGDLLSALAAGEKQTIIRSEHKPDLSISPVPRFDLLTFDDYASVGIQTCRGCPFDCEFCDIVHLNGRTPRYKHPDQVIEELETLYRLDWRGRIFICDDNFIGNKNRARGILEKLIPWMKSHGEPFDFWTQTSVNLGQDRELMDLMTEANFSFVFVGIESPDDDVLALSRKQQNIRNPLLESVRNINRNGLSVIGSFIIGFDGEEKSAGERICSFVEAADIPVVMINLLAVGPHTDLRRRLEREGRLLHDFAGLGVPWGKLNYVPTRPESEIVDEYVKAWDYLYEPGRFLARTYRCHLAMRPTRGAMGIEQETSPTESIERSGSKLRARLQDLVSLLLIVWWNVSRRSSRRRFWTQLNGIRRRNPSRLMRYIITCAVGESMLALARGMPARVEAEKDRLYRRASVE